MPMLMKPTDDSCGAGTTSLHSLSSLLNGTVVSLVPYSTNPNILSVDERQLAGAPYRLIDKMDLPQYQGFRVSGLHVVHYDLFTALPHFHLH